MRNTLISLIAVFAAVLLMMLGSGALGSYLSVRLTLAGFPGSVTGVVMAAYYAGLVAGSFIAPRIVRRAGHIRAFAAFAGINTSVALAHGLVLSPWIWGGLRLLTGISLMGMYMVVESWLNERAEPALRGRVFSVYMTTTFLGLGLGQFLLGFGDPHGPELFMIVGILFALSLVPVTLTRTVHPQPVADVALDFRSLIRRAPLGVVGCVAAGLANGAFYALGPAYALHSGLDVGDVALFMGVTILSGLVLQWPVGSVSDRYDRRTVLGLLNMGVALACVLLLLAGHFVPVLLVAAGAMFGGLAFTVYPVAVAHANDYVSAEELVPASAALILAYGIGASLGPLGAAATMVWLGPKGLFVFVLAIAVLAGTVVMLNRREVAVSVEEQSPFVAMPRTSAVIANLDPRAEEEVEGSVEETVAGDAGLTP